VEAMSTAWEESVNSRREEEGGKTYLLDRILPIHQIPKQLHLRLHRLHLNILGIQELISPKLKPNLMSRSLIKRNGAPLQAELSN